jgi:hypothetical protein
LELSFQLQIFGFEFCDNLFGLCWFFTFLQ